VSRDQSVTLSEFLVSLACGYSLGSLGREFQRVHQAAFGQLYLEAIFGLRLGATQRRIRRFLENGLCRQLTC
jgi:hypothetical protein